MKLIDIIFGTLSHILSSMTLRNSKPIFYNKIKHQNTTVRLQRNLSHEAHHQPSLSKNDNIAEIVLILLFFVFLLIVL